ncbi:MAG: molecular chaperone HtpG [Pseudomonadota bacterium]
MTETIETEAASKETLGFQTEVRQLLHLMIHSLYSNKEIFLRELISNASDAADKLRFEALADSTLLAGDPDLKIDVSFDKDAGTLTISDNGIGMSRDEVIENLGTIARSGTAEFLQQLSGDQTRDANLIGQFGVGFYSAFIVADKVSVETRRAGAEASAGVRWTSDGEGEFTIESVERDRRGTDVTLYLKSDSVDFADAFRLESLIRKYSDHIGFPVSLADLQGEDPAAKTVNSATALWTRPRTEVTDDEYREFYKHLSHDFEDPMSWSHNKVEGRREYTSLLFIPARAPFDLWNREAPRGLKLYIQRVFIMDEAEQFLPLYLRFVKGVIDSADLPLNVSRELLQQNPELEAMRGALTKRALDMIAKLAAGESADDTPGYGQFWTAFGTVLKEGFIEDPQNSDKLLKLMRFATTDSSGADQNQSLDDYVSRMQDGQDKIYYLLADTYEKALASPQLERLKDSGVEVLLLIDKIDPWVVEHLPEYDGKAFQDISRADLSLPDGDGEITQSALNDEHKPFLKKLRNVLKARVETVNASQRLKDSPACVVTGEQDLTPQIRRMLEAAGQEVPESLPVLEVNVDHPLVANLSLESDDTRFEDLANIVLDQALLAESGQLSNPGAYLRRVNSLLSEFLG